MENLVLYSKSLGNNLEINNWITTVGKRSLEKGLITVSALEHILDFLYSSAAPKRLRRLNIKDAKRLTDNWVARNKRSGAELEDGPKDIKTFIKFSDGSHIVKLLTEKSFKREGFLMSHCLGGYSIKDNREIYSLRDAQNKPHATFEIIVEDKEILQIKGKCNGPIHPKYIERVLKFLKKLDMEPRPSEMSNLGYYVIDPTHLDFVRKTFKNVKLVTLNNVTYAVN